MDTLGSLCAGIEVTWESDRIRRPGFRAGFTSSHHTRQTSHPQTSALPRPPSLPHPSQHACLLSLIMRGTENKTFSSKEISGCDRLLLTLVGRRDLLMPSKHSLTRAWRIFHSPPSARPNYLIPPSHAGNNFPEVSSRLQQLCRADFKSTQRSSVSFPRWHWRRCLVLPQTHTQNAKALQPRAPPKTRASHCSSQCLAMAKWLNTTVCNYHPMYIKP